MTDANQRELGREAVNDPAAAERLAHMRCRDGQCCAHRLELGKKEQDLVAQFVHALCARLSNVELGYQALSGPGRELGLRLKQAFGLPGCDGCGATAGHFLPCPQAEPGPALGGPIQQPTVEIERVEFCARAPHRAYLADERIELGPAAAGTAGPTTLGTLVLKPATWNLTVDITTQAAGTLWLHSHSPLPGGTIRNVIQAWTLSENESGVARRYSFRFVVDGSLYGLRALTLSFEPRLS